MTMKAEESELYVSEAITNATTTTFVNLRLLAGVCNQNKQH